MATRMQQRRGTAAQWTASDPILNIGEIGFESDNNKFKIGDGVNHWDDLPYFLDEDTISTSMGGYLEDTLLGANNGVAQLNSSGKLVSTQLPSIDELTQDAIDAALVAGTGLDKTYNDVANTITIDIDSTVATLIGTQTFTNKTLTSPVINTPTGITKSDVGLGSVNNTSDANKPVSSAQQTALDLKAPLAAPAFTGTATAVNLTISGDLTVNGTTTNLNSTSLVVEDKNVVLGDTATPTDTTADGGGITLKGATDKTFNWVDATDAWTSSEHINLASGKTLKYNGTDLVAAQSGNSGKYLTTDGTSTSWGTVTEPSAATVTTAGIIVGSAAAVATKGVSLGFRAHNANSANNSENVAIGVDSLKVANSDSDANTAVGTSSGLALAAGTSNTLIGYYAGYQVTNGEFNTYLGMQSGKTLTTGSNNIAIGYNAQGSSATVSNEITLGNSSITAFRIPGLSISASTTALTAPDIILSGTNGPGSIADELALIMMGAL
jgi:hypothetical protein